MSKIRIEMSDTITTLFEELGMDEITKRGYQQVGIPALLVDDPRRIGDDKLYEVLSNAIKKTNGEIAYDAIACYWKTNEKCGTLNPKNSIQRKPTPLIGNAGGLHLIIAQALKYNRQPQGN